MLAFQDTNQYVEQSRSRAASTRSPTPGSAPTPHDVRHHADRLADALRGHRPRRAQQLHQQRRHLQLHERHRDHHADRPLRATSSTPAAPSATARRPATINLGGANGQHDCTTRRRLARATRPPRARPSTRSTSSPSRRAAGCPPTPGCRASSPPTSTSTRPATPSGTAPRINFYRSGGGCRNTGEIAAVFDHEWGHGLDDNDADGALSNSSEGYADIAAIYRLQASCVGHGFFQTLERRLRHDRGRHRLQHQRGPAGRRPLRPRLLGRARRRLGQAQPPTRRTPRSASSAAAASTGTGPCGRQVHCAAAPVAPGGLGPGGARPARPRPSASTARPRSSSATGSSTRAAATSAPGTPAPAASSSSGCGATNGYMQWLAADDDNGNLNDGTPHMTAHLRRLQPPRHRLRHARRRRTAAARAGPRRAPDAHRHPGQLLRSSLSWTLGRRAPPATGCSAPRATPAATSARRKIAEVTGTSYTDTQVANGRTYYYNVVAAGASSACYGRASNCVQRDPDRRRDARLHASRAARRA